VTNTWSKVRRHSVNTVEKPFTFDAGDVVEEHIMSDRNDVPPVAMVRQQRLENIRGKRRL
jgi:hypothetical protein